jgi:hypothetical protein
LRTLGQKVPKHQTPKPFKFELRDFSPSTCMDGMIHPENPNLVHQGKANHLMHLNAPDKDGVNPTLPHMV